MPWKGVLSLNLRSPSPTSSSLLGSFLKTGLCSLSTHTAAEFNLLRQICSSVVSSQWAMVSPSLFQHVIYEFFLPSPCLFIAQPCSCIEVVHNCFTICLCLKGGSNTEFSVHLKAQHLEPQFCHLLIRPFLVFSHPGILHSSTPRCCCIISRLLQACFFSATHTMTVLWCFLVTTTHLLLT